MITIFGTTYFTTGSGLVVLVLAAPFLFWLARWLWRPNVEDKPRRVRLLAIGGTTLGLLALLAVGLFWDVYLIGQRAKELCQETGLVVYRKAPAKSFVGSTDIRSWSRDGFDFVEHKIGGKLFRIALQGEEEIRTEVAQFESQFELVSSSSHFTPAAVYADKHIARNTLAIVDRRTSQALGTLTSVTIDKGWLDRMAIRLTGFVSNPSICGKDLGNNVVIGPQRAPISALVKETLSTD